MASINELVVLSNMESFNAELIDKSKRYIHLHRMAGEQLSHLNAVDAEKRFRTITDGNRSPE